LLDTLGVDRAAFMGFSWGGDVGVHVAAKHHDRLLALVLLDAGYRDPFDPNQSFEAFLEENGRAWEDACAPSWEVALGRARERRQRWTAAIEEAFRAAWREEGGRLVPSGSPAVVAAVEHGMSHAFASTVRPALGASELPVLLVAAGDAATKDLARFRADVPQAEIHRMEGAGHDVLADGGPASSTWSPAGCKRTVAPNRNAVTCGSRRLRCACPGPSAGEDRLRIDEADPVFEGVASIEAALAPRPHLDTG
jgi:pimeloyl-ACP methyl ester carboxylesterase